MKRQSAESSSKVRAVVRIRPLSHQKDGERCLFVDEKDGGVVELVDARYSVLQAMRFSFDAVYDCTTTQLDVFANEVEGRINPLFRGINSTIFCYGMTGAGKTHTMVGNESDPGLIPRSVSAIFHKIPKFIQENPGSVVTCSISFFEIYNEKIFDLIDPTPKKCDVLVDSSGKTVVSNIKEKQVSTPTEFHAVFSQASKNRSTAATNLNKDSSRSHALLSFKLVIQSRKPGGAGANHILQTTTAKMYLVDLAGSEDNRQTGNVGQRMAESAAINTSLTVLNNVVRALNKGGDSQHIPYRDSKLTRLLQDSLGGGSFATMIANVAPGIKSFSNTQRALEFAAQSRTIVNNPSVNVSKPVAVVSAPASIGLPERRPHHNQQAAVIDDLQLESMIAEAVKKAGFQKLNEVQAELKNLKQEMAVTKKSGPAVPPKTPNTRTKEYAQIISKSRTFEAEGNVSEALLQLQSVYKKMQKDPMVIRGAHDPNDMAVKMFKAVAKKVEQLKAKVNELSAADAASKKSAPACNLPKTSLLSAFNKSSLSDDKENLKESAANAKAGRTSPAGSKAATKKRKRAAKEDDDDDEYDVSKDAQRDESEEEIEPEKPKKSTKRAKTAPSSVSGFSSDKDLEAAKGRIRYDISNFSPELHAALDNLMNTLNQGNEKQICKLHGIGKKRAELIIKSREQKPFESFDQLLDIGLGEKLVTSILKNDVILTVFYDKPKEEAKLHEQLQLKQHREDAFYEVPHVEDAIMDC